MQYMLLIYGDQDGWKSRSEEENGQIMQAYYQFTQELQESGSIDEALAWAAKVPGASHGSVEVRPVMVFEEDGASS